MRRALCLLASIFVTSLACGSQSIPKKALGEACALADDCSGNYCVAIDSGTSFCSQRCESNPCPTDYRCRLTPKGDKACIPLRFVGCKQDGDCPAGHRCDLAVNTCYIPVTRDLCAPCTSDKQCPAGGACITALSTGEQFCSVACGTGDTCAPGYYCRDLSSIGYPGKQCLPNANTCNAGKGLCRPCSGDSECGGALDLCVRNLISGERFCGRTCKPPEGSDTRSDCPEKFTCVDLSGSNIGPFQCVPITGTCVGYCDTTDEHLQTLECGLGKMCNTADNQCTAAVDGRACGACHTDDDCLVTVGHEGSRCIVNNCQSCPYKGETFCAPHCAPDGSCPVGFACVTISGSGGPDSQNCVPVRGTCSGGLGTLGDDCRPHGADDCLTGICVEAGTLKLCSAQCSADADCRDARYHCCKFDPATNRYDCKTEPAAGEQGLCAPVGLPFGADCSAGRPPCASGACLDIGTARLCTNTCATDGDCPTDFVCSDGRATDADGTQSTIKICFPGGGGDPGANCNFGPAACRSRLCLKKTDGNICTTECKADSTCPAGWKCKPTSTIDNQQLSVCVPPQLQ